jgi:hypothetical protein
MQDLVHMDRLGRYPVQDSISQLVIRSCPGKSDRYRRCTNKRMHIGVFAMPGAGCDVESWGIVYRFDIYASGLGW